MDGKVNILISCFYFIVGAANAIDKDYYWGFLRASDCDSEHVKQDCRSFCKGVPVLCHEGECYCHRSLVDVIDRVHVDDNKEDGRETIFKNSALRHHIAHFCPDLDKARECIRKCIGTGKPAFCGKDHVCYCGHRYSNHDSQNEQDAMETYKQFKDMYIKYLGVSYPGASGENLSDESSVEK